MASSLAIPNLCLAFTFIFVIAISHSASAQLSCNSVYSSLYPCVNYAQNGGPVPANCCSGVKSILASANSKALRQTVCNCLKSAAAAFGNADLTYVKALPGKCKVSIPYQLSPNIDCTKGIYVPAHAKFEYDFGD